MKNRWISMTLTAGVMAGVASLTSPAHATTACADMPNVSWWGNLTHESTVGYVDRKHGGNWSQYLAKWTKYETRMKDVQDRGATAIVRSTGKRLHGAELADYISKISARVSVIRCLAATAAPESPVRLNNVATSAGAGERRLPESLIARAKAPEIINKRSFSVTDSRLNLTITTMCSDGDAVFIVRNEDRRGRTPSNFSLYSDVDAPSLASRRMWLGPRQSVRFSINADEIRNNSGSATLRIEPVAARAAHYDASIDCGTSLEVNRSPRESANRT